MNCVGFVKDFWRFLGGSKEFPMRNPSISGHPPWKHPHFGGIFFGWDFWGIHGDFLDVD